MKKKRYICNAFEARMAESVDALVSNTNGVKLVPVRDRLRVPQQWGRAIFSTFFALIFGQPTGAETSCAHGE